VKIPTSAQVFKLRRSARDQPLTLPRFERIVTMNVEHAQSSPVSMLFADISLIHCRIPMADNDR
jgi:hypothetical protein